MNSAVTHKRLHQGFFLAFLFSVLLTTPAALAGNVTPPAQSLSLTVGDQTEIINAVQLDTWFSVQTKLTLDTRYRSEIENTKLCPTESSFCDFILSERTRASLQSQSVLTPNKKIIQSYVDALNTKVSTLPVDAKFTTTNNKIEVFSLSQDGNRLDTDASVSLITDALAHKIKAVGIQTLSLPVITLKPTVQSSNADALGITELIGEGRTNFSGSPKNRIHNFTRAMEQFNGVIIAPHEEFSFVKYLGEVDGDHGYLPELVIKNNKTEPEFGGGICQVSSTVFRAAIYSGLKITARRNHAYPVKYYTPYGMDATVYIPKPDLSFTNTTPGSILMQASIEGNELIFRFYGTSDGRKTEVDGPHILERNPNGSMKTTFTQKVTDANGNIIVSDEFKSNYKSPSLFPHPGQEPVFTEKPADWSQNQWSDYKKTHGSH